MANVKISALPITTATTLNDVFVKNNSGETITSKVLVKNALGLTSGTGVDSIKSASFLSSIPAQSAGVGSIAIGQDSEALADYSTAIGNRAEVFDGSRFYGTAIGANTRVAQYSTALGADSQAIGANGLCVGYSAFQAGNGGIAIGNDAYSEGNKGIAIGDSADERATSSIAIGDNAGVSSLGTEGIAIGKNSSVTADNGIAIGEGALADLPRAVVLGQNLNSKYSGSTMVEGLDTNGNITDIFYLTPNVTNTFNVNFNISSTQKVILAANSTVDLTNIRNGGRYRILFENGGAFDITAITSTLEGGGSVTNYYNGGGRDPLTASSEDIWYVDVINNKVYVTQFANYTT
jgi:hypothetical protein